MPDPLQKEFQKELEVGRAAAKRAGEIALSYYRHGIGFEAKADLSPVTAADRECERAVASLLEEAFPDDGLLGEEGAAKPSRSGRRWIIDPIDGTRDFVRGSTAWAVLIGLEAGNDIVAGFAFLPAIGDLFCAARGHGAFCNDEPIRVSSVTSPSDAVLCLNGFNSAARLPFASRLLDWIEPFWAVRSMGGCLDAVMVARGQADLWIEPSGKPWDFAPLKILIEEAGGRFFDFQGGNTIYGGNCVLCTPGLEAVARAFVSGAAAAQ